MKRLIYILLSIIVWAFDASTQVAGLNLIIGQNIFLPGQNLWYGIQLNESSGKVIEKIKQYPTVFLTISDLQNNVVQRMMVNNKSASGTSMVTLPKSILPGTYILSATLYSNDFSNIIEEQAIPVHILGDGNDHFKTFGEYRCPHDLPELITQEVKSPIELSNNSSNYTDLKQSNNQIVRQYHEILITSTTKDSSGVHRLTLFPKSNDNGILYPAKLRDRLCFEKTEPGAFVSISNAAYLAGNYTSSFQSKNKDFLYGYSKKIRTNPNYQMPGFFDSEQNQVYQFKRTGLNGENFIILPYFEKEKSGQYLDLISKEIISDFQEIFPIPKWMCRSFIPIELNKSRLDSLQAKLEKAEIISRIFNQLPKPPEQKKSKPSLIQPDNFIDLTQYQLFENIELFLAEAVDPVKVIRTKGKPVELRLLRDDIKSYYAESPTLLINGKIFSTISMLFDIPFREISTISIFRSINATRKAFGPLGRFGIIEITTKSTYKLKSDKDEKMKGFETTRPFIGNEILTNADDPTPRFSSLQVFGFTDLNPSCYIHNDEKGRFLMQVISGDSKRFYSFEVH